MRTGAIIILLIIILIFFKLWYVNSGVKTVLLDSANLRKKYHEKIKAFEKELADWYPLGHQESFRIDHGSNYYRFFQRLGEMHMVIAVNKKDKVVGVGCGMLRSIPMKFKKNNIWSNLSSPARVWSNSSSPARVWYIGDVKISKKYRKRHIPWQLMRDSWWKIFKSACFYGISMDPKDKPNPVIRLGKNIPFVNFKIAGTLLIYSCNFQEIQKAMPIIYKHRGLFCFVSLLGIKDIILKSNRQPMPLLHVHWGAEPERADHTYQYPVPKYTHMFCCPAWDPMVIELASVNITTQVTATILHCNMDQCDWKFILTSSI